MIKDSAKELFEIVLVWKLDRFSRDRYDSAHYKHILKKNGVKVVSAKEHISEGPEGIILEAMLEGYAEFYSAELSEKIHRGQKENALKGKNNGGGVPLGYLLDKKAQKLVIDPVTAPLVVEIFEKYADGKTVRSIVEDFNARGLRTKKGQPFNINSFSALLKNRKYIGEYRYQDVVIEGGVPAIIPENLFNRVQERMEKNRHAPAMAKDYLLTTKLFCGKCERMMVGESGKSHTGAMHYYYKCSGAKRLKDCDKKAVRKDWIERVVVRLTMQRVMDEEKINRLIDAILVMQEQEDTTTPALRSQLAETESFIGNILKAIEQGIFTPSTKQRLDELEARKEEILVNIQTAELQKPKLTREQMTAWFEQFRHGDPANRDFQKRLIDTFVNAVYVFDDKLVLTYNYQHGTQTISLEEIESALSSDFDGATPPKARLTVSVSLLLCGGVTFAGQDGRGTVSPGVTTASEVLCMNRILFICHGNICRSPMAEAVMRHLVKEAGAARSYFIDSAATSREELGNPIYPPAKRALAAHGIPSGDHTARQMTRADYDGFDLLIGMDHRNLANMRRIAGSDPESKICLLLAYAGRPEDEVADPWYTGDFEATFRDVRAGCLGLLAALGTD